MRKLLLLLFPIAILSGCGSNEYYRQKYGPATDDIPTPTRAEFKLEEQVEGHTCGFHALSTIYKAYSLDPAVKNLRFRLGVDKAAIPFDSSSLGSLHPDIFRVATQDGFNLSLIDPESGNTEHVCQILANDYPILTLIKRRENGNLYWIVLSSCQDNMVTVYDSLFKETYKEPLPEYMNNNILSMIALEPSYPKEENTVWKKHREGIAEVNSVANKIRQR